MAACSIAHGPCGKKWHLEVAPTNLSRWMAAPALSEGNVCPGSCNVFWNLLQQYGTFVCSPTTG